ncbi:hypothetical protein N6B72_11580 [Chryseobacterium soli]|uniref:hypothetical protein n=1 Tax=Chryseobacterium soli TaxID=445961 RepID=UPI002952E448|nr:hypothetical protein [Chryseobacterium soli]MDV7697565.1 hypothetical protein [Chryseobacterium soli]
MKTNVLVLFLLGWVGMVFGQISVNDTMITIYADMPVKSFEIIVESGTYNYKIENPKNYSISITRNAALRPHLSTDVEEKNKKDSTKNSKEMNNKMVYRKNTEYIITIYADDEPKERIYKIKSQSDWSWTTSFGANAVLFTNRSKFTSLDSKVIEVRDGKMMDLMPSIMFTFINNHKDLSPGFTGGLGFNFEELSVFAGGALGIGQNIILTAGIAVHKQNRPNLDYTIGQNIDSSVTSDNLNKMQYRANPFIGISFRFDKNPFASK